MLVVHTRLDAAARTYFQDYPINGVPLAYRPRLARKTHPAALLQSTAGLWLLGRALEGIGHDVRVLDGIQFDDYDRPHLTAGPAFSIAHSDHFAACAIADTPDGTTHVGLDIEKPRPIAPARLARLAGNDAERTAIAEKPDRFFDYWCAREATVKATGRVGLARIRQVRLENGHAWLDGRCWTLYPLTLAADLRACLASNVPDATITIRKLTALAPD